MSSRPLCTLVTPLRREERSICPATILLEKLLEKLRRTSSRHEGSTTRGGRSESERGEEVEENEENTGIRIPRGRGRGKALSFSLPGAWRGRGDTTQETDFFACLRRA